MSAATSDDVVSIRDALRTVDALRRRADDGGAVSAAELTRGIALCEALARAQDDAVSRADDDADDVPTATLPLLRVDALRAALEGAVRTDPADPAARLRQLQAARAHYAAFLVRMRRLRIVAGKSDDDGDGEETAAAAAAADPAAARTARIEAFRRKREAKALVDSLEARRVAQRRQKQQQTADDEEFEEEDEADARERWLAVLRLEALDAQEQLAMASREAAMLAQVAAMRAAGTFDAQRERDRAEMEAARREAAQRRPITIVGAGAAAARREELRAGVFRPFGTQPTMTPEQAAEIEMAEAQMAAAAAPREPTAEEREEAQDSDKETDESVAEQRRWDEWRDTHPRGSGNTIGQG